MPEPKDAAGESGPLNFDDDEIYSGRGKQIRRGGTWEAKGSDSGKLGAPAEILSDKNGPSDPAPDKKPGG